MNRLIILFIFFSNLAIGQSKIQHEPERIFNKLIEKPTNEYAKENNLKLVTFYRDTVLSSSVKYDINGNYIETIGMENKAVRKSTYKWNEENQIIEKKHFSVDGSFRYGYFYKYIDGVQLMYEIEDSLLFRKRMNLKGENISTYSEYDKNGKVIIKNVYVKDDDLKWLLESCFENNIINRQFRFEYIDNKKYVTKVEFDDNGTKIKETRNLAEIKFENRLEEYYREDGKLFSITYYNKKGKQRKKEMFDKNAKLTRIKVFKYNTKGQLIFLMNENFTRNTKIEYSYQYDDVGRVQVVTKKNNKEQEYFRYVYETY